MLELFEKNIEKVKTTVKLASALFVLTIASIIIFNTIKISDRFDLSFSDKALKHLIKEHKINESFGFIRIEFRHEKNSFGEKSDSKINLVPSLSLFLISTAFIFYVSTSPKKLSYSESFQFADGFKNTFYRHPPRYIP